MTIISLMVNSSSRQCSATYSALLQEWFEHHNIKLMKHLVYSPDLGHGISGCFHCWNVNCVAETSKQMPYWSRKHRQSLDAFQWMHSDESVWSHHKKRIDRMEACLAANGWYFDAWALFSLSHVRPRLSLTPHGLKAHGKSVESRTCTVSSRVTLARESRWTHSARVYTDVCGCFLER